MNVTEPTKQQIEEAVAPYLARENIGFAIGYVSAPLPWLVEQRCSGFWLGARREEREYPQWSLTDEQQSTRPKAAQPRGWR